jgi:hypothetical protein
LVLVLLEGHHVAPARGASTAVILNLGRLWCSFQLGGGAQVGGAQIWLQLFQQQQHQLLFV